MKYKFNVVVFCALFAFCFKSEADENSNVKVAHILGNTIYTNDLALDLRFLKGYKRSNPHLSEAEVLDKMRYNKLTSMIWKQIFDELSKEHDLEPTDKEVLSFTEAVHRSVSKSPHMKLTPEFREASLKVNRNFVKTFKISKHLYEKYGGTVIFQQGNPQEPVGAYRKLLEEYKAQGKFKIYNPKYEETFWAYYLREHPMVIPQEKVDFSKPWWEKEKSQ